MTDPGKSTGIQIDIDCERAGVCDMIACDVITAPPSLAKVHLLQTVFPDETQLTLPRDVIDPGILIWSNCQNRRHIHVPVWMAMAMAIGHDTKGRIFQDGCS